jgi:glycosyltransferase involved in cell wall biosynthesis
VQELGTEILHEHVIHPVVVLPLAGRAITVHTLHAEKLQGARALQTRAVEWCQVAKAGAVVAVSAGTRSAVIERLGWVARRAQVIPNGIDCAGLQGKAREGNPGATLGPGAIFVMAARLDENKCQDIAIRALAEGGKELASARLVLAGTLTAAPDYVRTLRELVAERGLQGRVTFVGPVENVPALLREAVAVLSLSRNESFGITVAEALALRSRLIVSDIPAHRWLTEDGRHALMVPAGDSAAVATAMKKVLAGEMLPDLDAGAHFAEREFDIGSVAEKYVTLYRALLQQR